MRAQRMGDCVRAFAPGRSEIAGNHVDHQGGRVIAATIRKGISATAWPLDDAVIQVDSQGFPPFRIVLDSLGARDAERLSPAAIVRGMAAQFAALEGVTPRGFRMQASSTVPVGGGLSSSAAFEMVLGSVINLLWAQGRVDAHELALMGQRAERGYFGKPCGLMDQLAIASGGIQLMDFADPACASAVSLPNSFARMGLAVCLVDVGFDHSVATADYASIPQDMWDVAAAMGAQTLSQVPELDFYARLGDLRRDLGDIRCLRAMHYYQEVRLVDARAEALRTADREAFIRCTRISAESSAEWLRNVFIPGSTVQPAAMAIALGQRLIGDTGAVRIHGGGFGGSVQAFVPIERLDVFMDGMIERFGRDSVSLLDFCDEGAWAQWI